MARRALVSFSALAALAISVPPAAGASEAGDEGPRLLATAKECPGQTRPAAPNRAQVAAMRCMVDFARGAYGLAPLAPVAALALSSRAKLGDVLRCAEFSHFACGRDFKFWIARSGYLSAPCWRVGENLAWGKGGLGTVRSILRAWLWSESHRANILGDYAQSGIGLRAGTVEGETGARLWSQHFGSRCAAAGTS